MQTSQVSNAPNVLTSTSAPNKQPDNNAAAEPFGKVLSREVSQRNGANEAPKNKEAGRPAPAQQPAKAAAKSTEAKPTKEGKAADKAQSEEDTTDAPSALPEEMLALVANLAEMNTPTTPAADVQTMETVQAAPDAQVAVAATILPGVTAQTENNPVAADTQPATATIAVGTQTNSATAATSGLGAKPDTAPGQTKSTDAGGKNELPIAAAGGNAAKVDELSLQATTRAAAAKAQDFNTAMSESLNNVTTNVQPAQQSALQALQQHAANTSERLTPRVGTPAWDQALGQKVVWMVAGEQQSASLTLNPPDLGPLQVVLNVSNSQANATFIAAQPEVRQALEAALPKLREMLGEAGIQLGQASVNSGTPNQQGSFDQQGSQGARGQGNLGNSETAGADTQVRTSRVQPASSGRGLVDTFV